MLKIAPLVSLVALALFAHLASAAARVPKCDPGEALTWTCDFQACAKFAGSSASESACCEKNLVFACVPSEAACAEARRTRRQCEDRETEDGLCDLARRMVATDCACAGPSCGEASRRCASARETLAHPSCASPPPRPDCGKAGRILARCPKL